MQCDMTVDFVVLGLGASGGLLLRMLKNAGFNAIGLESGVNHDNDPIISQSSNAMILVESYGWKFLYQRPSTDSVGLSTPTHPLGRSINYTTGRAVGGGTCINGMQYLRGSIGYWDTYAAINGEQWNGNNIYQAFKDLENFVGVPGAYDPTVHGEGGGMQIRQAPVTPSSMNIKFTTALANATGQPMIQDYNNPDTELGVFTRWSLFQNADGTRATSSTNFLQPIMDSVIQGATVDRIIFNKCKRAVGVKVIINGVCKTIKVNKEIIITCGVYSSEILQRSGIGDAAHLSSIGIEPVYDNPFVGKGLRNHLISTAIFTANPLDYPGTGNDPDSLYVGGAFLPQEGASNIRGSQWLGINPNPGIFVAAFAALDEQSSGYDEIQSKDPFTQGKVDENALANPADLNDYMRLYQNVVLELNNQLHSIDPAYNLISPTPDIINDPDKLALYIKDNISITHHWIGTCKMAPEHLGGVVDPDGCVYGVTGLRVGDVSVAPNLPKGNTAGPATVIGYKIAQAIIKKYYCK